MQRIIDLLLYFGIFASISSVCFATDVAIEGTGPQLMFSPPPFLSAEELIISITYSEMEKEQVSVTYLVRNNSNEAWSGLLQFKTPERAWDYDEDWYRDRSFSDLAVMVDGMPIDYQRDDRAFWNGHDISDELKLAGIDPNLVDLEQNEVADRTLRVNKNNKIINDLHDKKTIAIMRDSDE
jgi:hypothetical protein